MNKIDIRSLNLEEMTELILKIGESKFRSKQVFDWLNNKMISNFEEMNNLPKNMKEKLKEETEISKVEIYEKLESEIDGTVKYLFKLGENTIIESVFMKYEHGNTVCISSQAGCRMGCSFCASTINGLDRNLTAGEMLAQVYEIQKDMNERISNIVVMGSGEPLENFENLIKFIEIVNAKEGLNISQRNITVSTCGLIDKMEELKKLNLQINLAVSLHAPNDKIRDSIMPINKKYSVDELISASKKYANETKRRITYEYALIKGVNDSQKTANELGKKIKNSLCHVNLIPVNNVDENNFEKSNKTNIYDFMNILKSLGISVTIRRELGSDINGACGQLRKKRLEDMTTGDL